MKRISALLLTLILSCSLFMLASCGLFEESEDNGSSDDLISTDRVELDSDEIGLENSGNAPQVGDWTNPDA